MMQEPTYQKVAGDRPLLYLMFWDPGAAKLEQIFGSAEKGRAHIDKLRQRIIQAGLKNPYLVALAQQPELGAAAVEKAGLDAISAYTSWGDPGYAGLRAAQIKYWSAGKASAIGKPRPNCQGFR